MPKDSRKTKVVPGQYIPGGAAGGMPSGSQNLYSMPSTLEVVDRMKGWRALEEEMGKMKYNTSTEEKAKAPSQEKKFSVTEDGRVYPDEDGDFNFKQAMEYRASILHSQGNINEAAKIIDAIGNTTKALVPLQQGAQDKGSQWSEFKEVAQILAGRGDQEKASDVLKMMHDYGILGGGQGEVTQKDLELMEQKQQNQIQNLLLQSANQPSPFTVDPKTGELTLSPDAKPSTNDMLMFYMIQQMKKQGEDKKSLYPVKNGNVVPLEDWIEVKRFEGDEQRKNEKTNALRDIGAAVRENAGTALAMAQEFISFMKGEQGSNGLAGTEWEEPKSQGNQGADENTVRQEAVQDFVNEFGIKRFTCPCGNQIVFTRDMAEAVCSQCGQVVKPQKEEQWTSEVSSQETTPSSSEEQSLETPSQA